jgi:enoyl-CoA hydratase/carnithine racemase
MSESHFSEAKLKIAYHQATSGKIAQLTLNKPKALNALDLDMVKLTLDALHSIRHDESIVAVLLDSEGEKAFCAGGDIVSMHSAMKQNVHATQANEMPPTPDFLKAFFTQEYRLDYCIHTFPKPIIAWGNGIIMGGGLGLFAASHVKIVTQTARIAMPEITIGLFPDVGGSYFLNQMPKGVGMFLGLTGASINANDTLAIGLADAVIAHEQKASFIAGLAGLPVINNDNILDLTAKFKGHALELRPANLSPILQHLSALADSASLHDAIAKLRNIAIANPENSYLQKALATFEKGSAITAHLVFEQLKRASHLTLAECFRMELSMAFTCSALGEFEEGVRALLIDKDNQPKWQYANIDEVPNSVIEAHFAQFIGQEHPLAELEQDFGE